MNASLVLENLSKLDNINSFAALLEIKFMQNKEHIQKVKTLKKLLSKALIDLAFDIESKLTPQKNPSNKNPKIEPQISAIIKITNDNFFSIQIKNFQVMLEDLSAVNQFIQSYEDPLNQDSIDDSGDEVKKLRDKVLLIISERLN